ncbi:MAG: DUF2510 domain-containing protein [Acidimicrobiales bacterium]
MTYAGWEPVVVAPYGATVPPGWYADASGQNRLRWWDGSRWTEHVWSAEPPAPGVHRLTSGSYADPTAAGK